MDVLSRQPPIADHRIAYGVEADQFGDLWVPASQGLSKAPLVVFFHGGWWKSEYDLGYAGHLCRALKQAGIACWSVEYRRVGEGGGGWPGTFDDAAAGFDFVSKLAESHPLDLSRVFTMGHSAGGHLAFWIAGRHHIDPKSELYAKRPQIALAGTIALAGAVDLRMTIELAGDGLFRRNSQNVYRLMHGSPQEFPARYEAGNPGDLLPFHVPQLLIQGSDDDQIPPELPLRWVESSQRHGDLASMHMIPHADHFDIVDPESKAWPEVFRLVREQIFG